MIVCILGVDQIIHKRTSHIPHQASQYISCLHKSIAYILHLPLIPIFPILSHNLSLLTESYAFCISTKPHLRPSPTFEYFDPSSDNIRILSTHPLPFLKLFCSSHNNPFNSATSMSLYISHNCTEYLIYNRKYTNTSAFFRVGQTF